MRELEWRFTWLEGRALSVNRLQMKTVVLRPYLIDGELIKDFPSSFLLAEHVWEVNIIRRGLGESQGIIGNYRLCITDTTLTLIRVGAMLTCNGETRIPHVEFALSNMRR